MAQEKKVKKETEKTVKSTKNVASKKSATKNAKVDAVKKAEKKAVKQAKKVASTKKENAVLDYAIVKKGNAQYLLEQDQVLEIPKIDVDEGKEYIFEEVLVASKGGDFKIGTPVVKGAFVKVFVIKQVKGEKLHGFKYKAKSRYRRTWGYRKPVTRIRVIEIHV